MGEGELAGPDFDRRMILLMRQLTSLTYPLSSGEIPDSRSFVEETNFPVGRPTNGEFLPASPKFANLLDRQMIGHVDGKLPIKSILFEREAKYPTEMDGVFAGRQRRDENVITVPDGGASPAHLAKEPG